MKGEPQGRSEGWRQGMADGRRMFMELDSAPDFRAKDGIW